MKVNEIKLHKHLSPFNHPIFHNSTLSNLVSISLKVTKLNNYEKSPLKFLKESFEFSTNRPLQVSFLKTADQQHLNSVQ